MIIYQTSKFYLEEHIHRDTHRDDRATRIYNLLVIKAFANIVKHTLNKQSNQIHYHKNTNQEPTSDYSSENSVIIFFFFLNSVIFSTTNHKRTENSTDESTVRKIDENHRTSHKRLPFKQLVALLHRGETVNRLENRDHAS